MKYARICNAQPSYPIECKNLHTLFFAGGCFWGLEAFFKQLPGIHNTEVGYANGTTENPHYTEVCCGNTGHVETVAITYDRNILPTEVLLEAFFEVVDPTTLNRQGNDVGSQYRSGIYYLDDIDKHLIDLEIKRQEALFKKPLVVEVDPLKHFWAAETMHQDYLDKNPSGYCHIDPLAAKRFIKRKCAEPSGDGTGSMLCQKKDTNAFDLSTLIEKQNYQRPHDAVLRKRLTPEQYRVTRENATEFPFTNIYDNTFSKGVYVDVTTGEPLFTSNDKFDSGCGWPSFSAPIDDTVITEHEDRTLPSPRTEVRSRVGNAHLGHVFADGPKEQGGLRYCINSAALRFIPFKDFDSQGYGYLKPLFECVGENKHAS